MAPGTGSGDRISFRPVTATHQISGTPQLTVAIIGRANTPVQHSPPEARGHSKGHEMNLTDATPRDPELELGLELTAGEEAILTKLEELQGQLDDLTEKVNNLNLIENDGLSVERY